MAEIQLWHWLVFNAVVAVLLVLDLLVFHRHSKEPTLRESAGWTVFWFSLALLFNGLVWRWLGAQAAVEFLQGYLVEWSLSMDNVFVFAVIFTFFRVPLKYQYRVLFWGILGAVVMRLTFILIGGALVQRFDWLMPLFGLFLIYTAFKLATSGDEEVHPDQNILLRMARRMLPVSQTLHHDVPKTEDGDPPAEAAHATSGDRFFVREGGRWCVTPLFLVLLVVESTDVLFAVDSVPAILGVVSADQHYFQYIAYTSNVFAILGLRALYFLLAGMLDLFRYLHYGLSAILGFVGLKMITEYVIKQMRGDATHLAVDHPLHLVEDLLHRRWVSLLIIVGLLIGSIVLSLLAEHRDRRRGLQGD